MAEVVWGKKANKKRIAFLKYGEKEFGRKIAIKMNEKIESYVCTLAGNPGIGVREPLLLHRRKPYHSIVIHKLLKLVYYIDEAKGRVYIVDLWDTRREPCAQAGNMTR